MRMYFTHQPWFSLWPVTRYKENQNTVSGFKLHIGFSHTGKSSVSGCDSYKSTWLHFHPLSHPQCIWLRFGWSVKHYGHYGSPCTSPTPHLSRGSSEGVRMKKNRELKRYVTLSRWEKIPNGRSEWQRRKKKLESRKKIPCG